MTINAFQVNAFQKNGHQIVENVSVNVTGILRNIVVGIVAVAASASILLSGVNAHADVGSPSISAGGNVNISTAGIPLISHIGTITTTGAANVVASGSSSHITLGNLITKATKHIDPGAGGGGGYYQQPINDIFKQHETANIKLNIDGQLIHIELTNIYVGVQNNYTEQEIIDLILLISDTLDVNTTNEEQDIQAITTILKFL